MKNKAARLHFNDTVKPLAQKYRRLPFHIRDKVKAELKNLEELHRADGSTPWVS